MLFAQIHLDISVSQIVHTIGICSLRICGLSCNLGSRLDLLRELSNFRALVDGPSISRSGYIHHTPAGGMEFSLCSHRIVLGGNLSHVIRNMLLKACVVQKKLALFVKLQPVLDCIAVQGYCLISKGIGYACFCVIVACLQSRLEFRIILRYLCGNVCVRSRVEIHRRLCF